MYGDSVQSCALCSESRFHGAGPTQLLPIPPSSPTPFFFTFSHTLLRTLPFPSLLLTPLHPVDYTPCTSYNSPINLHCLRVPLSPPPHFLLPQESRFLQRQFSLTLKSQLKFTSSFLSSFGDVQACIFSPSSSHHGQPPGHSAALMLNCAFSYSRPQNQFVTTSGQCLNFSSGSLCAFPSFLLPNP